MQYLFDVQVGIVSHIYFIHAFVFLYIFYHAFYCLFDGDNEVFVDLFWTGKILENPFLLQAVSVTLPLLFFYSN